MSKFESKLKLLSAVLLMGFFTSGARADGWTPFEDQSKGRTNSSRDSEERVRPGRKLQIHGVYAECKAYGWVNNRPDSDFKLNLVLESRSGEVIRENLDFNEFGKIILGRGVIGKSEKVNLAHLKSSCENSTKSAKVELKGVLFSGLSAETQFRYVDSFVYGTRDCIALGGTGIAMCGDVPQVDNSYWEEHVVIKLNGKTLAIGKGRFTSRAD